MEITINKKKNSFKNIRIIAYMTLFVLSFVQFSISEFSLGFFFINLSIITLTGFVIYFFFRPELISKYIFPIFLTFSYNFGSLSGPLLFKTIFLQPLFSNLINPVHTFFYLILMQIVIIFALIIFINSKLLQSVSSIFSKGLSSLKNFNEIDIKFINFLFLTYLFFFIILYVKNPGGISFVAKYEDPSILIKFINGTQELFYVPLIYYFKFYFFDKIIEKKKFFFILFFYFLFLFFIFISGGGRTIYIQSIIPILFLTLLFILYNKNIVNLKKQIKIIFLIFVIFITSMNLFNHTYQLTRHEKVDSFIGNITYKFEFFFSKIESELYESDESYVGNNAIDRLIFPKYFDLFDLVATEEKKNLFYNFYITKFISIFPKPILNIFEHDYNKNDYFITSKSFLQNIKGGGAFSLGSVLAEFKYIFENFYILFWLLYVFLAFTFFHSFQKKNDNKIILSPVALIFLWWIYHFFFTDSIHQSIGIIRQILQTSIVYYLFFQIFRLKIKI